MKTKSSLIQLSFFISQKKNSNKYPVRARNKNNKLFNTINSCVISKCTSKFCLILSVRPYLLPQPTQNIYIGDCDSRYLHTIFFVKIHADIT